MKKSVASLERENKELKEKLRVMEIDRDLYRDHLVREYRTQRENVKESKYTPAEWLMSRISHTFALGQPFFWRQNA